MYTIRVYLPRLYIITGDLVVYIIALLKNKNVNKDWTTLSVLSISFEVDVPTGKVGGSVLFERRRRERASYGGLGACPPRKVWKLDAWKCYFQRFQTVSMFITSESLGSSLVKMSQAFHDPLITSICFNFLYFHWKVNMFKTPEMCPYLSRLFYNCFCGIFSLF